MKKGQKYDQILGIRVSSTQKLKVLSSVRSSIAKWDKKRGVGQAALIVTPNPEMVNRALRDKNFAKILNSADFSLPDGVGLVAAHRFAKSKAPKIPVIRPIVLFINGMRVGHSILFDKEWLFQDLEVIKGRVFFMDLIKLANKKGWKVFLLGGGGVAHEMKESLERSFKKIRIKAEEGPRLTESGNAINEKENKKEKEIVEKINKYEPHILFVGFSPPKQEKWLNRWLPKLKVGMAMTVGGSFDYMSGRVDLPPKWMDDFGLEWLWRLIKRPTDKFAPSPFKRIKRVLTAFPIFPLRVFWFKLTKKF